MAGGPRDYTTGTGHALFRTATGTCYFLECLQPVIREVNGNPVVSVEIAHIRGAFPGSARYDPAMTDTERAAHSNLMLMCTPHHKEIDRLHPDEYSVELLTEWKRLNEPGGIEALRELDSVNESNLESLIVRALESRPQTRQVEVDTLDSFSRELGSTTSLPFPAMLEVRRLNPHLKALDRFVVTNIRNVGAAAVTIQSVGIKFVFELDGATGLPEFMLVGRNSFPLLNPLLPKRLLDGESTHWLTDPGMFGGVQTALRAGRIVSFHSEVHLASGELIASDPVAWSAEYFEE